MKNKALTLIASSLLIMNAATANSADTLGKDMDVSASIASKCTLDAANATLNFGDYEGAATLKAPISSSDIVLTCNGTPSYKLFASTVAAERKMTGTSPDNTSKLTYNLFTNATENVALASDNEGSTISGKIGGENAQDSTATLNIYGSIDINQYLPTDTYTQKVSLVLEYL
jgi:spore coat protein U-like protein